MRKVITQNRAMYLIHAKDFEEKLTERIPILKGQYIRQISTYEDESVSIYYNKLSQVTKIEKGITILSPHETDWVMKIDKKIIQKLFGIKDELGRIHMARMLEGNKLDHSCPEDRLIGTPGLCYVLEVKIPKYTEYSELK